MSNRQWAQTARDELQLGRRVRVKARGHSVTGRIGDGDTVTLTPCVAGELEAGDIVLARIKGRRYFHLVLHLIHERTETEFLIGSNNGRIDGWIGCTDIFGIVTELEAESDD